MVEIIAHIVGMNNKIKDELINLCKVKYSNLVIEDLDKITNKIRSSYDMIDLTQKLKRSHKGSLSRNNLIKNINKIWKDRVNEKLETIYKKNKDKKIIFLGLCTYHRNHKLKVCIETNNKIFLKLESKKNAKDTIEYNLEEYKNEIINGEFPLRYIDYNFLIDQRERLVEIYSNLGYKEKTFTSILNMLEIMLEDNSAVYVSNSTSQKGGKYNRRKKNIKKLLEMNSTENYDEYIGYDEKWLALLSSINNYKKHFKKGYLGKGKNKTRFIEERYPNAFELLDVDTNLFKIDKENFNKINWYKYKNKKSINLENGEYINNVRAYMDNNNIKLIKYSEV